MISCAPTRPIHLVDDPGSVNARAQLFAHDVDSAALPIMHGLNFDARDPASARFLHGHVDQDGLGPCYRLASAAVCLAYHFK